MPNELTDDIVQQLLQLPYEQRDQLANTLINSLHPAGEDVTADEWKDCWTDECQRRMVEIDNGDVSTISAHDLIARMRAKHGE